MKEEQARIEAAGKVYAAPTTQRALPELPPRPTWRDVLHRAFHANGELEAAYFEWRAAMARIPQVASYPNVNLAPSFSYMFSGDNMKAWDRTTVEVGFDPMENLAWPTKVAQAGKIALHDAEAAGARFEEAKFDLQRNVLTRYYEMALLDEQIRIERENVSLLHMLVEIAAQRIRAGASEQELLRARIRLQLAENELERMTSERDGARAMLNGMIGRPAQEELVLPPGLPEPRPLLEDDARLIAVGAERNPLLEHHVHALQGREDALELARMQYIPDINPFAGFTGSVSQMVGAMVVLPTSVHEIRGMIDESRAMLRSAEAMLVQVRRDRGAQFIATLYALRAAERQAAFLRNEIVPAAERLFATIRQGYAAGIVSFADLIDAQQVRLDVQRMLAEQTIARETRLAELEALAGVDIETLDDVQPTGHQHE